jgi:hypothetical protein
MRSTPEMNAYGMHAYEIHAMRYLRKYFLDVHLLWAYICTGRYTTVLDSMQ